MQIHDWFSASIKTAKVWLYRQPHSAKLKSSRILPFGSEREVEFQFVSTKCFEIRFRRSAWNPWLTFDGWQKQEISSRSETSEKSWIGPNHLECFLTKCAVSIWFCHWNQQISYAISWICDSIRVLGEIKALYIQSIIRVKISTLWKDKKLCITKINKSNLLILPWWFYHF